MLLKRMNATGHQRSHLAPKLLVACHGLGKSRIVREIVKLFPELLLLVAFYLLSHWLKASATLPLEDYQSPVVFVAFLTNLFSHWKLAAEGILGMGLLFWGRSQLHCRWPDLEWGLSLRLLVGVSLVAVAWPLITSEYNYFVDRSHLWDRLLVAVLAAAVIYRPAFVFAFLAVSTPLIFEFAAPIGRYSWAFFGMPLHVLTLFAAWLLLGMLINRRRPEPLVFLLFCLIAGHYWIPGVPKLRWGWLFDNHIFYLLPATYSNGWLAFLSPESISSLANKMAMLNFPMKLGALILECGCLLIVTGKRNCVLFFLAGYVTFHLAVLAISGIFLWQWMMVEGVVFYLVWKRKIASDLGFFSIGRRIAAVGIVALAPYWLQSAALSWYDSPVNYVYRFESVKPNGERYSLGPRFFSPFDELFSFSAFSYLMPDQKLLPITWGATSKEIANELKQAHSPSDIFALEMRRGQLKFDVEKVQEMREFLIQYVSAYNRAPRQNIWLRYLTAPPGIVTLPRSDAIPMGQTISRIEVTQVVTWFDKQRYQEIRRIPVLVVDVPPSQALE